MTDEPNGSWVPASDRADMWVSVGPTNTCEIYDVVNGEAPDFSIDDGEELTRHVMCCETPSGDVTDVGTGPLPIDAPPATPKPTPIEYTIVSPASTDPPTPLPTNAPTPNPTEISTPLPTLQVSFSKCYDFLAFHSH